VNQNDWRTFALFKIARFDAINIDKFFFHDFRLPIVLVTVYLLGESACKPSRQGRG
jgi:CxxC motif-containing protein (DUF1111 family)